jgi:hypothetical protein
MGHLTGFARGLQAEAKLPAGKQPGNELME